MTGLGGLVSRRDDLPKKCQDTEFRMQQSIDLRGRLHESKIVMMRVLGRG